MKYAVNAHKIPENPHVPDCFTILPKIIEIPAIENGNTKKNTALVRNKDFSE